ncbi:MAG: nuclear transport factor 2 family protein [Candidatus Poribacteria bacterium]|nr:nuclear transport factor 2 family protein [Candidatus Poribacteria bacterium]
MSRAESENAIRNLVALFAHYADTRNAKKYAELFAPDGALLPPGAKVKAADIEGFIKNIPDEFPKSWHTTSAHWIEMIGDDKARGGAYYVNFSEIAPDHWGAYTDEYSKVDGRWVFQTRRVTIDGTSESSPLRKLVDRLQEK